MNSNEIRDSFLKFFENKGHKIISSAPLVPENDPSVLFNTAGMQPLVPYLLGQKHPMGARLASSQKCVRTGDIDDVGDNRHLTFFEMLGNWSFGDYFKEDAIKWSFEFLTDVRDGLGLDISRIYVTVFEGDENAPRDNEAFEIWKKYIPENRIYFLPAKNNWWSAGENGPCGPDTEIFYDINQNQIGNMNHSQFVEADDTGKVVEIWNNVFMQYEKAEGKVIGKLAQHNVDTGMGLERITMICQKVNTVFETDLFKEVMKGIKEHSGMKDGELRYNDKSARILADHTRTALFLISDGVIPSNKDRGYILRRLIRRAIMSAYDLGISLHDNYISNTAYEFVDIYEDNYPELNNPNFFKIISDEENKFVKTLEQGLKEFEKGTDPFILFTSYGYPIELTEELALKNGYKIDKEDFNKKLKEHQDLSRSSSAGMFKGGLANSSDKTIRLHTAHHLLLAALQAVVDPNIKQKGSNITEERLRMDFICDHKLTDDEKKEVEDWVNEKINEKLSVVRREMLLADAEKIGAQMEFGAKYPDVVSVYFVEDEKGNAISKEFCGGPHVSNTFELALNGSAELHFKIQKEEAVAAGVRRIKAILG